MDRLLRTNPLCLDSLKDTDLVVKSTRQDSLAVLAPKSCGLGTKVLRPWTRDFNLLTLCQSCHSKIHRAERTAGGPAVSDEGQGAGL